MNKTYRSIFLVCDSCKLAADSDTKCCKHCGRPIWLKDAEEITKQGAMKELVEVLSHREKIMTGLQKWLPVIFPENYCVAPNPMPPSTLEFLEKNLGKNRVQSLDILGYGYDAVTRCIFVFGERSMLYYPQNSGGKSFDILYNSVKELEESAERLTINNSMIVTVVQKRALAELLSLLTKVKITTHNGSKTAVSTGNNGGSPAPKAEYTLNDYIRDNKGKFMKLVMYAAKIYLGLTSVVAFSIGAFFVGILFAIFAVWVNYDHPIVMLLLCCLIFYGAAAIIPVSFIVVALICRYIMKQRYKKYMESIT